MRACMTHISPVLFCVLVLHAHSVTAVMRQAGAIGNLQHLAGKGTACCVARHLPVVARVPQLGVS
jgi:hypothetical protein